MLNRPHHHQPSDIWNKNLKSLNFNLNRLLWLIRLVVYDRILAAKATALVISPWTFYVAGGWRVQRKEWIPSNNLLYSVVIASTMFKSPNKPTIHTKMCIPNMKTIVSIIPRINVRWMKTAYFWLLKYCGFWLQWTVIY